MDSESIVQNGINDLIDYFETHRDCFFNENDLHHVFYGNLSNLGNLVRPEYPTRKRFFGKKRVMINLLMVHIHFLREVKMFRLILIGDIMTLQY